MVSGEWLKGLIDPMGHIDPFNHSPLSRIQLAIFWVTCARAYCSSLRAKCLLVRVELLRVGRQRWLRSPPYRLRPRRRLWVMPFDALSLVHEPGLRKILALLTEPARKVLQEPLQLGGESIGSVVASRSQ